MDIAGSVVPAICSPGKASLLAPSLSMILAVIPLTIPLDFDRSARKREDILLGLISEDPTGGLRDDERDKLVPLAL